MSATRVLVPTDFSSCSRAALNFAVALAKSKQPASIILLHVVEPLVPSCDDDLGVLEPEALRTESELLAASRGQDVQIDAHIVYGVPAKKILSYVREHGIDLIVMGTHGKGGILDFLIGDTAEIVMRKATCPVLTVRDDSVLPFELA